MPPQLLAPTTPWWTFTSNRQLLDGSAYPLRVTAASPHSCTLRAFRTYHAVTHARFTHRTPPACRPPTLRTLTAAQHYLSRTAYAHAFSRAHLPSYTRISSPHFVHSVRWGRAILARWWRWTGLDPPLGRAPTCDYHWRIFMRTWHAFVVGGLLATFTTLLPHSPIKPCTHAPATFIAFLRTQRPTPPCACLTSLAEQYLNSWVWEVSRACLTSALPAALRSTSRCLKHTGPPHYAPLPPPSTLPTFPRADSYRVLCYTPRATRHCLPIPLRAPHYLVEQFSAAKRAARVHTCSAGRFMARSREGRQRRTSRCGPVPSCCLTSATTTPLPVSSSSAAPLSSCPCLCYRLPYHCLLRTTSPRRTFYSRATFLPYYHYLLPSLLPPPRAGRTHVTFLDFNVKQTDAVSGHNASYWLRRTARAPLPPPPTLFTYSTPAHRPSMPCRPLAYGWRATATTQHCMRLVATRQYQ